MFAVKGQAKELPELLPLTQVPLMAKQPAERLMPTLDVDVAWPEIFNPRTVVVPKPSPAISRAEMDVVDVPSTVVVES